MSDLIKLILMYMPCFNWRKTKLGRVSKSGKERKKNKNKEDRPRYFLSLVRKARGSRSKIISLLLLGEEHLAPMRNLKEFVRAFMQLKSNKSP